MSKDTKPSVPNKTARKSAKKSATDSSAEVRTRLLMLRTARLREARKLITDLRGQLASLDQLVGETDPGVLRGVYPVWFADILSQMARLADMAVVDVEHGNMLALLKVSEQP